MCSLAVSILSSDEMLIREKLWSFFASVLDAGAGCGSGSFSAAGGDVLSLCKDLSCAGEGVVADCMDLSCDWLVACDAGDLVVACDAGDWVAACTSDEWLAACDAGECVADSASGVAC